MCNDFSCIVTRSHQVVWERGISSHDSLYSKYVDQYPELKESSRNSVKVEITPDKGYLYPDYNWTLKVDESDIPSWWSASHATEANRALRQWKKEIYPLINIKEAQNPINPLAKKSKPTKKDIELLKQWASVWASVWDSVLDSVWDSVLDSVWDSVLDSVWDSVLDSVWDSVLDSVWDSVLDSVWASVWAYSGSLFYIWEDSYKLQPCVDLWKRGFVPSFDGKIWRLHSGPKAEIVYEWIK